MGRIAKAAVVIVLAIVVVGVIAMKKRSSPAAPLGQAPPAPSAVGLPQLVDLGSTTCIPCKMMAPILDELKAQYAGRMDVRFVDAGANPDAAKPFGIKLIPTQVFLDASGKELWRHEGFISKDDILAKWKELGVDLPASPATSQPASTFVPVKSGST